MKIKINKKFSDGITVTDPGYDSNEPMTAHFNSLPSGTYEVRADAEGGFVRKLWIVNSKMANKRSVGAVESVGKVATDSGLLGIFSSKPNYDDEAWQELVTEIHHPDARKSLMVHGDESSDETLFETPEGAFVRCVPGDGEYDVLVILNKQDEPMGLMIWICD